MRGRYKTAWRAALPAALWLIWPLLAAQGAENKISPAQGAENKILPAQDAQNTPRKWPQPAGLMLAVKPYQEAVKGSPGYAAELDLIEAQPALKPKSAGAKSAPPAAPASALYPNAAEIGRYVNAQALQNLFSAREESAAASAEGGAAEYCADSAWKDNCANELYWKLNDVESVGSFVSLRYGYSYMPVGAAHPMNSDFTYNFSLKPLFLVAAPEQMFDDTGKAFPLLQKQARALLAASLRADAGAPLSAFEEDMLKQGTESWRDFANFMLTKTGLKLVFSPYAVAPYAAGTREAEIPYSAIQAELKPFYRAALGLN